MLATIVVLSWLETDSFLYFVQLLWLFSATGLVFSSHYWKKKFPTFLNVLMTTFCGPCWPGAWYGCGVVAEKVAYNISTQTFPSPKPSDTFLMYNMPGKFWHPNLIDYRPSLNPGFNKPRNQTLEPLTGAEYHALHYESWVSVYIFINFAESKLIFPPPWFNTLDSIPTCDRSFESLQGAYFHALWGLSFIPKFPKRIFWNGFLGGGWGWKLVFNKDKIIAHD